MQRYSKQDFYSPIQDLTSMRGVQFKFGNSHSSFAGSQIMVKRSENVCLRLWGTVNLAKIAMCRNDTVAKVRTIMHYYLVFVAIYKQMYGFNILSGFIFL